MLRIYVFLTLFLIAGSLLGAYSASIKKTSEKGSEALVGPRRSPEKSSKPESGSADPVYAFTITSTVKSHTREPMPGVNVIEKGTTNGTSTDSEGRYPVTVSGGDAVLIISFIGYTTQEISVGNRTTIDVSLQVDIAMLQEVVAVGFGRQDKRDVTDATSTVKESEIARRSLMRVQQALQGTTPGEVVSSTSGQPGTPLSVRIRGSYRRFVERIFS